MSGTVRDFAYNRNRTIWIPDSPFGYQVFDEASRVTTYSGSSPRVKGRLKLQENAILRTWSSKKGSGIHTLVMQTWPGNPTTSILYDEGGFTPPDIDQSIVSELTLEATNSALAKFHSDFNNSQMQLMEYILERESTKESILGAFRAIIELRRDLSFRRLFKTLRIYNPRTRRVEPKRVEMSLHEKWLAYNFFWSPLISDVYKIFEGFTPVKGEPIRKRSTASRTILEDWSSQTSRQQKNSTYNVRVTIVGSVIIEDPLLAILDELGLADPAKIFWNWVPFSFVADWFINIGQILDQISSPGRAVYQPSVTTLVAFQASTQGSSSRSAPQMGSSATVGTGYSVFKAQYSREPGPLPMPSLNLLGGLDSVWRVATSVSLIRMLTNVR